jgi:hypothetical protein
VQICIGSTSGNHVMLSDLGVADQDGWVSAELDIQAGFWRGIYRASFQAGDFPRFRKQLQAVYDRKANTATFFTMEDWLALNVTQDHLGHVHLEGTAIDEVGTGNVLTFHLDLDQSYLPAIIADLESVERSVTRT